MFAYKVLSRTKDGLLESFVQYWPYTATYLEEERKVFPDGPAFCYETFEQAVYSTIKDGGLDMLRAGELEIWEVDIEEVDGPSAIPSIWDPENVPFFWEAYHNGLDYSQYTTRDVPGGTIYAHSVQLLRRVSHNEVKGQIGQYFGH